MTQPITRNTLFSEDNLPILRDYIPDESVDLVYLDPLSGSQINMPPTGSQFKQAPRVKGGAEKQGELDI